MMKGLLTMSLPKIDVSKPFVLVARSGHPGLLHLEGEVQRLSTLSELAARWQPVASAETGEVFGGFFLIPYRQIAERGYAAHDGGEPLLLLKPSRARVLSVSEFLAAGPAGSVALEDQRFDVGDDDYVATVRRVIEDEIAQGEGANFVIARSLEGRIRDFDADKAMRVFRNLLAGEYGAYWVYLFYSGDTWFVGATPERHLAVHGTAVRMNPISGTFRKTDHADSAVARAPLMDFLRNRKEIFELFMVVDEELKMMSRICGEGGQILGPYLKEMGRLIHTEYVLAGRSSKSLEEILRLSMFAPTVTGSPLENACRIIRKYETGSRGYYSGIVGLRGLASDGKPFLDSSIVIRTAEISADGFVRLASGATLVRDSDPVSEMKETVAKAGGTRAALSGLSRPPYVMGDLHVDEEIQIALNERNTDLSRFWFEDQNLHLGSLILPELDGRRVAIMDNEDAFTQMQAHMMRRLGVLVEVVRWEKFDLDALPADTLVLIGPGPGNPMKLEDPKIAKIHQTVRTLLDRRRPFLAVCLGHQVTSLELGLPVIRKEVPAQGVQALIDYFGKPEQVGFYNTFAAIAPAAPVNGLSIACDHRTREIHAIRSAGFWSVQFHPESILSQNGCDLLREMLLFGFSGIAKKA
jgi:phenazine biosynthesis protein phzE